MGLICLDALSNVTSFVDNESVTYLIFYSHDQNLGIIFFTNYAVNEKFHFVWIPIEIIECK